MNTPDVPSSARPSNPSEPFLRQVKIRNYKSIGKCDVRLGPLTVLVGRNGSGKSNFMDALRFVADGLQTSLDHSIRDRGGIEAVRRRSAGHPRNFAIELRMNLPDWQVATYGFEVAARQPGGFVVKQEHLRVFTSNGKLSNAYRVEEAEVIQSTLPNMPPVASDRLYLVNAAGLPGFRNVYNALASMGFYNLNPEAMKDLQNPDAGDLLHRDGSNIASVIGRLGSDQAPTKARISDYLRKIVPGLTEVKRVSLGPRETLEFRQEVLGATHPWKFHAASMSDGTLRALGALVAATQLSERKNPVSLVGIEEPETALHPAAAGALTDALREATANTQVLVTSHSPDLLDQIVPESDTLLAVQMTQGNTEIGPVDNASSKAIQRHLYSPGELLRMDQLGLDEEDLKRQRQLRLFDLDEEEQ